MDKQRNDKWREVMQCSPPKPDPFLPEISSEIEDNIFWFLKILDYAKISTSLFDYYDFKKHNEPCHKRE